MLYDLVHEGVFDHFMNAEKVMHDKSGKKNMTGDNNPLTKLFPPSISTFSALSPPTHIFQYQKTNRVVTFSQNYARDIVFSLDVVMKSRGIAY